MVSKSKKFQSCSNKIWIGRLLCLCFCLLNGLSHGQRLIDSLKLELNNPHPDSIIANFHFDICEQYYLYHEDSLDLGIYHCKKVVEIGYKLKDLTLVAQASNQLGQTYNITEELDSALHYYTKSMNLYEQEGDSLRQIMLYDNSANVLVDQGKFDEALQIKQYCMEYFRQHADSNTIAASIFGIAWLYMERREGPKSIPYFRESIKYAPHWDLLLSEVYGNMASIYRDMNKVDSALYCFRKTAQLGRSVPSIYTLNMSEYAKLKQQIGELDSAKVIFEEVLRQPGQDKTGESYNLYKVQFAHTLVDLGQVKKAKRIFYEAMPIVDKSTNVKNLEILYKVGQKVNEKNGDFQSAYAFLQKDRILSDSIKNAEMQTNFKEIETKFETDKKNQQIAQLAVEDELNKTKLTSQRRWIFGLVGGLGLLLFMLQRIFGQNKKINAQKSALTKALDDKNMLLKEIHHRVKNNLQVVSSLLSLQSRYVDDHTAKDAIQTGKARVQSMSLLHQNIYKNENLKTVNIQKYFDDLGENLFSTYQLDQKDIDFTTDIDDVELDIDIVVPMGLITNELISNSLKHAFKGREKGQISLSIKKVKNDLVLKIADDGVGIPTTTLPEESDSLGMQLIKSFSEKLDAKVDISNIGGTSISLTFNPNKLEAEAA